MISVIIPSKTDAYVNRLMESIEKRQPDWQKHARVFIADNGLTEDVRRLWHRGTTYVEVADPFIFAKAINLCLRKCHHSDHVLIMNDDTEVLTEGFFAKLAEVLEDERWAQFGILTPRVASGSAGNTDQMQEVPEGEVRITYNPVCFVAAVIRSEVRAQVGELDQRFRGYGWEDTDYNRRAVDFGWKLGVIGSVSVGHGGISDETMTMSGTYRKQYGTMRHTELYEMSKAKFEKKWGKGPQLGDYGPEKFPEEKFPESVTVYGVGDGGGGLGSRAERVDFDDLSTYENRIEEAQPQGDVVRGEVLEGDKLLDALRGVDLSTAIDSIYLGDVPPPNPRRFTRDEFSRRFPCPKQGVAHGRDTDIEQDLALLWSIVKAVDPTVAIELGTRQAISTKAIRNAMRQDSLLFTLDPDPNCRAYLNGTGCTFVPQKGEDWLRGLSEEHKAKYRADFIFVDTDPHSYSQTKMWLDEFIPQMLSPGGCAAFHDVRHEPPGPCVDCQMGRHDIKVSEAVRDWLREHQDWTWVEFPPEGGPYRWTQGGLGLLWAPEG